MDSSRRSLVVSLALSPVLTTTSSVLWRPAAAGTAPGTGPIALRASAGADPSTTDWRYARGDDDRSPVLCLRRGSPFRLAFDNHLAVPTSLDFHGLRVPPPLGGTGPVGGAVASGATAEITFTPPDSGTFWFHPWITDPRLDATARGLAGVIVVDDSAPPEVDHDLVALLTDRPAEAAATGADRPGAARTRIDRLAAPRVETLRPGSRVRLRLVNGSTTRALALHCMGVRPSVVAIDGQPSDLFMPRGDTLPLAPGARFDIMFDMPRALGTDVTLSALATGADVGDETLLILKSSGEPRIASGAIAALPPNPKLPRAIALEASKRVSLVAALASGDRDAWSLNDRFGFALSTTPLFTVKRGRPVTLTFRNAGPRLVGFRVHGACLRILHDLDDGWEPYWRESILVPSGATHHVAFVPDLPGRWLIESPFFAQSAGGLRCWYEVM